MKIRPTSFNSPVLLTGFCLMLMTIWAWPAIADDIGLSAQANTNEISLEDSIQLSLTVNGVMNAPEPQLPPMPDFRIRSTSTSSSTQTVNGQRSVSVTYNYQLVPLKTGTLIIKPATLELAGKIYRSEAITIFVSKPDTSLQKATSPAYVESFISNANPYVNEQVVYTFRLYRRVEAKNLDLRMSYEDDDFRKEEMGDAKIFSRTLNGIQYKIHELSTALYPIHSGKVEISSATLGLDLIARTGNSRSRGPLSSFFSDPIFGSHASWVHKTLRSQPISVNVQPIPDINRPKNFSNIVGDLSISADIGKAELPVGDTTTLTVTIKGPGNVKNLSYFLPEMKSSFKVYPDQPDSHLTVKENTLKGEKIFKFALVPLKEGKISLPSISLSYFDPIKKIFATAETPPIALNILPGENREIFKMAESLPRKNKNTKYSVKFLGEDILPIHTRLADFEEHLAKGSEPIFFAGSMIVPPLLFFLFTVFTHYNQRLKYDTAFVRNRKAFKVARGKLTRLSTTSDTTTREFAKILSEIFREYIGNKLNVQGKAITSMEVERKLVDRHYPQVQAELTRTLLEKYESLQYAPPYKLKNADDLIGESLRLMDQLEKQS